MDVVSLKKYIYDNKKIEDILSDIGCHDIRYNSDKKYYSACHKDGDNPMGVVIYNNEFLGYISYSRNVTFEDKKDLIELIQITLNIDFKKSVKYLHDFLGLKNDFKKIPKKKKDNKNVTDKILWYVFERHKNESNTVDINDINFLDEELVNDYVQILHISWLREGIMPWTANKFGLAYTYKHKRVVIPHRYWLNGELLGFNQRTVIKNYEELGIRKYYLTKGMNKSINIYGLYENYDSIIEAGYVVVYESEKSVLKRDSLGDSTGVALSGKNISDEQVRILIGLGVDIIIALDNDVGINDVRYICEKFYGIRNVSYIKDNYGLLGEKDSPADLKDTKEVIEMNKKRRENNEKEIHLFKDYLFDKRIEYDKKEHDEYIKSLSR